MRACKYVSNYCNRNKYKVENTEQLINLANMYLSEWTHRDSIMWKQVFSYFISCLVVMLLPFMSYFGIDFNGALPKWIFPVMGLILSTVFFVVSKGYAIRLQAIGETYQRMIEMLPKKMQRTKTLEITKHSIYNINMAEMIVYVMFIALWVIGVIILYLCWQ